MLLGGTAVTMVGARRSTGWAKPGAAAIVDRAVINPTDFMLQTMALASRSAVAPISRKITGYAVYLRRARSFRGRSGSGAVASSLGATQCLKSRRGFAQHQAAVRTLAALHIVSS